MENYKHNLHNNILQANAVLFSYTHARRLSCLHFFREPGIKASPSVAFQNIS